MLFATALALCAAVVHAVWNLLIKTGEDRATAAWGVFAWGAAISVVGLMVLGGPGWNVWPALVTTTLLHLVYIEALVRAYVHGDFSVAYPMARGTGAVLAALGSVALLGDHLPPLAWVAITVAAAGLASLRVGEVRWDPAFGWALLTGLTIAAYSLVDSAGSRASTGGAQYGLAVSACTGTAVCLVNVVRRDLRARAAVLAGEWRRNFVGGAGSVAAYTMVLVAVRHAPVGYVTMLRESSVVLGAIMGWLVLGEPLGHRRTVSSVVMVGGLAMLIAVVA